PARTCPSTRRPSTRRSATRFAGSASIMWDLVANSDVCLWHKADMLNALTNVRFWGQSGRGADAGQCLLMTQSRHSLLFRGSPSQDHRQSFRTAPKFEVGALYWLTIEVHVKRLFRLDREG